MIQALGILLEGILFQRLIQRYRWIYPILKGLTIGLVSFLAAWILYALTQ